jgi:hemerythrin-like metal-binding protein
MQTFVWSSLFETGIALVDVQHHGLVDIINRVGNELISETAIASSADAVYGELASYAQHHFADEERLMSEAGIDPQHLERHRLHHRQFVGQLETLWRSRGQMSRSADALHGFLSSWLTFHILDEDQEMARLIRLARPDPRAELLAAREAVTTGNASAVLLGAVRGLYQVLSVQNKALSDANLMLEEKVRARTRDLLQSEKMAAIGQLAAGVAHEINNPIGFVNSNLGALRRYAGQLLEALDACGEFVAPHADLALKFDALSKRVELPFLRSDLISLLDETCDGLARVKNIVQALQDYAHADSGEKCEADLLVGLESTLRVAANELKYKVDVIRQLTPLPLVRCSLGHINQVFMNLLVNAAQAVGAHGTIILRSGFDASNVWVEVTDTGSGISEEQLPHLFEPFFTTKPVGKGTGLGLSMSWDIIVNQHGGKIDVRSTPGQGSSFTIWLPRLGVRTTEQ